MQLRLRETELRVGLIELRLIIARIDPDEQIAFVHEAVVVDVHRHDIARYLRRDRDGIAVGVGVVGADLIARQEPPDERADRQHHDDDAQNDQRLLPGFLRALSFALSPSSFASLRSFSRASS